MLTTRFVTIYGWISLGIMAVMLALMWFKVVPPSYYMTMFIIAVVLFSGRIVLRIMSVRQERRTQGLPED